MIKPIAIDHVCLSVDSLTESKAYFERLFKATVTLRKNDNQTLLVEMESVRFFITKSEEIGLNQHLSFRVDSLEPVKDILKQESIPFSTGTVDLFSTNNYHWIEWLDPNGIRLECVELKNAD